jgi:glyoxylase I family protein
VTAPRFGNISHLDLSVSDVEASAEWYQRVLGLRRLRRVEFPGRTMIVLRHESFSGGAFDEHRAGLDHVGFAVATREELDSWETHLAALGVAHSAVADAQTGSALVFRDPDNIQLEFWWSKP